MAHADNNKHVVIDSSIIVKWISSEDENLVLQSDKLLKNVHEERLTLSSPILAVYEVGNAIKFKKFSLEEKIACLENFYTLPINFYNSDFNDAQVTIKLAGEYNITYYDAVFLVLAQKLNVPLITANPKHQKSFAKVKVISLKDYI